MPVFFVILSPQSAKWHVSLAITSCDIVTAHHVRVRVVVMMVMGMMGMEMMVEMVGMVGMVVAVMMIARLVMLNVVKHLYQVNIPPLSTD